MWMAIHIKSGKEGCMKHYIRKIIVEICLMSGSILLLCSCGKRANTEEEIRDDILLKDGIFTDCGLEISSFSIEERKTIKDSAIDEVWCSVNASNELFSYEASYYITYYLYDQGWIIDDFSIETSKATPKESTILQEDAYAMIPAGKYIDIEYSDRITEFEEGVETFFYTANIEHEFYNDEYIIEVIYLFNPYCGWEYYETAEDYCGYSWNEDAFLGKWSIDSYFWNTYFEMDIQNIDLEKGTINCTYSAKGGGVERISKEEDGTFILSYDSEDETWYYQVSNGVIFGGTRIEFKKMLE